MTNLERRLGSEIFDQLVRKAGGTRISVPDDIESSYCRQALETRFGQPVALLLIFHFPGEIVYIPKNAARTRVDDIRVARMTKRGRSAAAIARKLNCSDRAVHASRARCRANGLLRD